MWTFFGRADISSIKREQDRVKTLENREALHVSESDFIDAPRVKAINCKAWRCG